MPYPVPVLSKRDLRGDVAYILGDNWPLESSGAGNVGGTTAVFASLINRPTAAIQNKYLLIEEGTNDSEYRIVQSFAPSTGTPTVVRAFTGQVASGISAHLHEFSPHLYTLAINETLRACYRALYKPVTQHLFVRSGWQTTIGLPRGMERVMRLREDGRNTEQLRDYFDRSDSTSSPGSKWTASTGTWGITSEGLYCSSDTDGDLLLAATNPHVQNGVIEVLVRGDITDTASRVLSVLFRYEDSSNYLAVRLLNNQVDLRKKEDGTESSLQTASVTVAEGTDALLRVMYDGPWVSIFVNDVQLVLFELTGANTKYLGFVESGTGTFGNVGIRLDKAGSPSLAATQTRIGHYFLHDVVTRVERGDWQPKDREVELRTLNRGWGLSEGRMLWVEGIAELSALAADTTFEALASDSTATVEIKRDDPAYEIITQYAAYVLLRLASQQAATNNPEKRAEYATRAREQLALAEMTKQRKAMRYHVRRWG